jgi:hypothetical protein
MELDDLRPPSIDEAFQRGEILRAPTIQRPGREAYEHSGAPSDSARDVTVCVKRNLLDNGAAIGDGGIDSAFIGRT